MNNELTELLNTAIIDDTQVLNSYISRGDITEETKQSLIKDVPSVVKNNTLCRTIAICVLGMCFTACQLVPKIINHSITE